MHWDGWKYISQSIHITEPEHGVVKSDEFILTDAYLSGWAYSTHGMFTNLLPGTTVVMASNEGDNGDGPTYIDYNYGAGKVLATMQTVEWGYFNGSRGWVGDRLEFLRNEIRFALKWSPGRIRPYQAAELAKMVIGAPYHQKLWEPSTKGFIWEKDKGYYFFTPGQVKNGYPSEEPGLDCSGLVFWAYNRAYYGDSHTKDREDFPLYYEGAEMQYKGNCKSITKNEVRVGDLLFFDTKDPGDPDHVAIYVGSFEFKGKSYNTIEATAWGDGIITVATYSFDTGELTTLKPSTGETRILPVRYYGRVVDYKVVMKVISKSPVDLSVTDPDGITITKDMVEVSGMCYMEYDINGDGELDDIIAMPERKIGDYLISVIPESGVSHIATYTLEVLANGLTVVLADNIQISDIPSQPYILRCTDTEIIPILPAMIDFDPDTLNLKSKDQWVTVYIELPAGHGYDVSQIDLASVMLNGQICAEAKPTEIGDYDSDGIPDLMVKFSRSTVQAILKVGEGIKIAIGGKLIDGRLFEGGDTIRVISQGK
jgi:hypothetical protein